jgi:PKHD-type hydroxylase
MVICIADVLTAEELSSILTLIRPADFIDGQTTAGWHARQVKRNTQMQSHAPALLKIRPLIQRALQRNSLFQMAALPKTISPLLLSRYEVGMEYGSHVDNAFMGDEPRMRSDLSLTLFLSKLDTYEGGELVIESTQGEQGFKLDAGSMIVYPSTTLHRVAAVTQGIRLAAVGWVQSLVRDAGAREILFDLDTARQSIFAQQGKTTEFDLVSKSYANLLRQWGDI